MIHPHSALNTKMNTDRSPVILILVIALVLCAIAGGLVSYHPNNEDLERYRGFLRAAEENLASALQKSGQNKKVSYARLKVEDGKLAWNNGPSFDFTLRNDSSNPIQKLYCKAQLIKHDAGHEVIAEEEMQHLLDAPLASGESRRLQIPSVDSGSWSSPLIREALVKSDGFDFSISITGAERPDGTSYREGSVVQNSEISRYEKEVAKYRDEIRKRE
jgi:hypothetical protein